MLPLPSHSPRSTEAARPLERIHWPSAMQFGLGLLAICGLWGLTLLLGLVGVAELLRPSGAQGVSAIFLLAGGLLVSGGLVLPSVVYALARLRQAPVRLPGWIGLESMRGAIFIWPVVVLIGHWLNSQFTGAWMLLLPFHILALGLPILWLLWLGTRGLATGSAQRAWGIFNVGLVVGPTLILLLEMAAAVTIFFAAALYISTRPELAGQVMELAERLQDANLTPEQLAQLLQPYLAMPGVPLTIFIFLAGVAPLIEELLKPLGVWFLGGMRLTPGEGFVAGLLSGAGFAFFENLAYSSQVEAGTWVFAVVARSGTSLIHMVTSGIFGWALVLAWRERRYVRLVLTYLLTIMIHGLWNGLTLIAFAGAVELSMATNLANLSRLVSGIAPAGMGLLTLFAFGLLVGVNRVLQSERPRPAPAYAQVWPERLHTPENSKSG